MNYNFTKDIEFRLESLEMGCGQDEDIMFLTACARYWRDRALNAERQIGGIVAAPRGDTMTTLDEVRCHETGSVS